VLVSHTSMSGLRAASSWNEVAERVAEARQAAHLTQEELADALGLDRTAVTKIESGRRQLDAIELLNLARVLRRSPEWFVSAPPPAVVSRRTQLTEEATFPDVDALVEELARDVELLVELGELDPPEPPSLPQPVSDVLGAEEGAVRTRAAFGVRTGPLHELLRACESVGLYGFSIPIDHPGFDGAYVALERGGVALVNGSVDPGRRRFNLAHELGHHVLADEYSADFALGESQSDREKLVNAFAIHLLMPRDSVVEDWKRLGGEEDPRAALVHMAADYRVSWTAACSHLLNLGLVDRDAWWTLKERRPTRADYIEANVLFVEELAPTSVPPGFARAALRAFRKHKLGADRTVELLRGTVSAEELPLPDQIPLDALKGELRG